MIYITIKDIFSIFKSFVSSNIICIYIYIFPLSKVPLAMMFSRFRYVKKRFNIADLKFVIICRFSSESADLLYMLVGVNQHRRTASETSKPANVHRSCAARKTPDGPPRSPHPSRSTWHHVDLAQSVLCSQSSASSLGGSAQALTAHVAV